MVTYELKNKSEEKIVYLYYPEGKKENAPGEITADMKNETITVTKLAENDSEQIILAEETNALIDGINMMRKETGEEPEPYVESDSCITMYGSHAINEIADKLNNGEIPENGTVMWY